ncbi:hypothetical protein [Bradyrhizobium guangdongense]
MSSDEDEKLIRAAELEALKAFCKCFEVMPFGDIEKAAHGFVATIIGYSERAKRKRGKPKTPPIVRALIDSTEDAETKRIVEHAYALERKGAWKNANGRPKMTVATAAKNLKRSRTKTNANDRNDGGDGNARRRARKALEPKP